MTRLLLRLAWRLYRQLRRLVLVALTVTYLSISRTIAFVGALYVGLYFLSGTSLFKDVVQDLVSAQIPGTITAATVQWGPLPWEFAIADGRVHGRRGEEVLRAEAVRGRLDVLATLAGMWDLATQAESTVSLHFVRVDIGAAHTEIHVDQAGNIPFEQAFVTDETQDDGDVLLWDITAVSVGVHRSSGHVSTPDISLRASGLEALVAPFSLVGDVTMTFLAPQAEVDHVAVTLPTSIWPDGAFKPAEIDVTHLNVQRFFWHALGFGWEHADAATDQGDVTGSGGFDVAPDSPTWFGDVGFSLVDGAALTQLLAAGQLDGAITAQAAGFGDTDRVYAHITAAADTLSVSGAHIEQFGVDARLIPATGGHALTIERASGSHHRGHTTITDGWLGRRSAQTAHGTDALGFQARISSHGIDLPALGDWLRAEMALPFPAVPASSWTVAAELGGDVRAAGGLALEGHVHDSVCSWDAPREVPFPADHTISGSFRYDRAPAGDGAGTLAPRHRLEIARLAVDGAGNRLRAQGRIDFVTKALDIEPYLRIGDIADEARRWGPIDAAGRLVLKAARLSGTLDAPALRGTLSWSGAAVEGIMLDRVVAAARLQGTTLALHDLRSESDLGKISLSGSLQLLNPQRTGLSSQLPFEITDLTATRFELGRLVPSLGLRAPIDLRATRLAGALVAPIQTLTGAGRFRAPTVQLGSETFKELSAQFDASHDELALSDISLKTGRGDRVTGQLTYGKHTRSLHGVVKARRVALGAFDTIRGALPSLAGDISATLTLGGTVRQASIIGRVSLHDVEAGALRLGNADIDLQTLPGTHTIDLSSTRFFNGFDLEEGSHIALDGLTPRSAAIKLRARDVRLSAFLPELARQTGIQATATATATVAIPGSDGATWALQVNADPGALAVGFRDQAVTYTNASPLRLERSQDVASLAPVDWTLAGRGEQQPLPRSAPLTVCGSLDDDGRLSIEVSGALALAPLRPIVPALSVLRGALEIVPPPNATTPPTGQCLGVRSGGLVSFTTQADESAVNGWLQPRAAVVSVRTLGREMRLDDSSTLRLQHDPSRGQQLTVLSDQPVVGYIDDGVVRIAGSLSLVRLRPERFDAELEGTELYYAKPGEFSATFNPSLHLTGRDLRTDQPSLSVSGDVVLTDGKYTKSFDTFAHALGSAIGASGSAQGHGPSLDDALLATRIDVDLTSRDFEVHSAFPLGRADMETHLDLSISGTPANVDVFRRIDILPGGSLTYRIFRRDFELLGGAVDFDGDADHPTIDVSAQTEITYVARTSSDTQDEDEKVVVITLRIHGRVPDLTIDMTADDTTLDQDDLQSLILTGRPRREFDRSSGSSIVTAELANVLNDVLKAPFVRTAAVGLSQEGDLRADVGTCFGDDLCLTTSAVQETTETMLRARFRLRLGDRLICDGTLRSAEGTTTSASGDTYEARCRYRVPLD